MATQTGMSPHRLSAALAAILVLAVVLPFAAVTTLHRWRIERADADLARIALLCRGMANRPAGPAVLASEGEMPRSEDPSWVTSAVVRPGGFPGPDPWGNAYLVQVGAAGEPSRVITAGPDGVIQTRFGGAAGSPQVGGDDRAIAVGSRD